MMDEAAVEKLDATPLQPSLAAIAAIKDQGPDRRYMGGTSAGFGSAFFRADIDADAKNPKINTYYLGQGGLGLPDRDYYLQARLCRQAEGL